MTSFLMQKEIIFLVCQQRNFPIEVAQFVGQSALEYAILSELLVVLVGAYQSNCNLSPLLLGQQMVGRIVYPRLD